MVCTISIVILRSTIYRRATAAPTSFYVCVMLQVSDLGVDMLTLVGHKFGAPKGVAALFVRRGLALPPMVHGGGQEAGRRAGTENVLLIAGMGKAAEVSGEGQIGQSCNIVQGAAASHTHSWVLLA